MSFWARAVLVLVLSGTLHARAHSNDVQHPDKPGLLALKATICGNCTELSTWESEGDPCRTFDGVYCAWVLGSWRVVGVQLQLPAAVVSFEDTAMSPEGKLAGLSYLRELEVLCVKKAPTPPPGPPKPQPTPSNTHAQQQRQHQQVTQSQQLALFRQQLWQGPAAAAATAATAAAAAAEHQGLHVSRWLAAASAYVQVPMDSHLLPNSDTGTLDASQRQRQQQQQQQQLMPAAGTNPARSGELPHSWFSAYPHLVHLRVVGCGASGVLQGGRIAGAKRLASLVLSHNKLQGTLPDSIVGLQHLSVLDLSNNQLCGPLPVSWTGMQHLHYLYLSNNNLTGVLPCEWTSLQLLLADLSGNHWHSSDLEGDLGSWGPSHITRSHITSSPITSSEMTPSGGTWQQPAGRTELRSGLSDWQQQQQQQQRRPGYVSSSRPSGRSPGSTGGSSAGSDAGSNGGSSGSNGGSSEGLLGQQLQRAFGGVPTAPRCWLRQYCYVEGAFICLQRASKGGSTGGCSSYVYGASDLHVDASNQCDNGGSNLMAVGGMFVAFGASLLLIWLHHCRAVKWMHQPSSPSVGHQQQHQQQQQQGPWQQRQWLISGPNTPRRARARSIGGGTGAAAVYSSSNSIKEPLLPQAPPTLPLLYHPATSELEGAGYSSPVSSSSAADFIDATATAVGTPDGLLPSALTTPSAGAISIRPQGGPGRGGKGRGLGARRGSGKGLAAAAAAGGRGSGGSSGALQEQSGYESDASSTAGAGAGDGTTAHLSAHWLNPGYYFQGNEPLPPWAGGVARMLAATLGRTDSSGSNGSSGCFDPALLLPLVFFTLDAVTNLRLLLLWGVGPPPHVKLWPSYALLGLTCVPHLLVGAVVHFRLLAVACLPEALKAAAVSQDAILSEAILPPGSGVLVRLYSWLFAAPAWVAYPLILLLLVPGVLLLTLLCPLVVLMGCCGLGSFTGVVRYIQLLQGCAALTQSAGSAGLLTVLFFMGNVPLEWAFLDSSLYYLTVAADLANISVAWWLRLQAVKRQQALALAALPNARGQEWS